MSTSATLSVPPSPGLKNASFNLDKNISNSPLVSSSTTIELIASRSSSSVFVYDLAEQAGFGTYTKGWTGSDSGAASVVSLQTRAGAGLSLVGRLSQGSSKDASKPAVLTAYTTPTGLATMAQSLAHLPAPTASGKLVLQVPNVTPVGESFALSPTLAPFMPALAVFPERFTILLSSTPQEAVDLATLAYELENTHVVHIFDHHSATREIGHALSTAIPAQSRKSSLKGGLSLAGYSYFDYVGDKNAEVVVVLPNGPLANVAKAVASRVGGFGVVVVRVLRPWDEEELRSAIPTSAKRVHVVDDVPTDLTQGALYADVFSALFDPVRRGPAVKSHRLTPTLTQSYLAAPSTFITFLRSLAPAVPPVSLSSGEQKKLLFFTTPGSTLAGLPFIVEQTFLALPSIAARQSTEHDVFSKPGGVSADRIVLGQKKPEQFVPVSLLLPLAPEGQGEADFLAVTDQGLLKSHAVTAHAKPGAPLLVTTSWAPAELGANLPADVAAVIRERGLRVYTIDAQQLAEDLVGAAGPERNAIESVVALLAFLRLYLGKAATEEVVAKLAHRFIGESVYGFGLEKIGARAWSGLVEVELPAAAEPSQGGALKNFEFNAIAVETDDGETVVNGARLVSWHEAAKQVLFRPALSAVDGTFSSFEQNPELRPDLPERTFLVTCTVNRRLTPLDYDRNVFHLEFDTRGTGLTYAIGEALGVHGWNDEQEVLDFCSWYGVDPGRLITIPVPGVEGRMHTRTVFQALQQQVDLFGKPGKTFYADLAEHAASQADRYALQFIGSPEGAATFKKLSEKDTVTFADILRKYETARPGIETLCELIGDIKPRHYSIASAQAVVGDRVDLLVVAVDWVTPSGSPRYGQCTRYLAGLKVGQKVTVSIKPSVMKLPPDNLQPIIMAGLGTGAAPFRAFLQYRAMLQSQGVAVGPTYYYFGSRHRSQEYLYGEEIEAFMLDGTISKAGLAFSRDGRKKVYIQHKMQEDSTELADMLYNRQGVFYLCGPTWPVPDVYEALVGALIENEGMTAESAGVYLEGLKEEERYVLEVY
ncbi:assimilatory sulfite reductase [Phanerochaete sordida]|uniref:assimilatory sulfite reductase (NADPH) n=1 Tax=Phanerochaete sordida TaxID=48140 RepID=A0A9P3FXM5_9APHY|nr:assimilatory sulfite reductase [Phanerochaete sordida]